ncbi:hypothetical protein JCM3766R1_001387 [Sporobolomyces carnicolor]
MDDDGLLAFGDFEIDTTAADARAARIAAARAQAKEYSAKIEDPGWFNNPDEVARLKDPTRARLFSLHQLYFERRWDQVVADGLELYSQGSKEEGELMDLIMRSWQKAEPGTKEAERLRVSKIAKRWTDFPTQASICHISAQVLLSCAADATSAQAPDVDLSHEALRASLASLRLNRAQSPFLSTLRQILVSSHPLLASADDDRSLFQTRREEILKGIGRIALNEMERDTLEHAIGLHGEEKETEEDIGRDVRSL